MPWGGLSPGKVFPNCCCWSSDHVGFLFLAHAQSPSRGRPKGRDGVCSDKAHQQLRSRFCKEGPTNFKVHSCQKKKELQERFRWIAGSVKTEVFIWCPARASATYVFRYPFAVVRAKLATAKHRQAHLNKMGMGPWRTRD
ncbi:hypothetical protein PAHAL_1G253200 [Panicum hallii]|uniref:Uncharacterized protein n=1 Tax=Panicum hallii TaxID=206008 RepID=A0A2T8KWC5_9POAL|nr:hypothetical protein PAHAL_1G253200 [Panicum hallii]